MNAAGDTPQARQAITAMRPPFAFVTARIEPSASSCSHVTVPPMMRTFGGGVCAQVPSPRTSASPRGRIRLSDTVRNPYRSLSGSRQVREGDLDLFS